MKIKTEFPDFSITRSSITDIFKNLPQWAGREYVNFSVNSWRRQNWIDQRAQPWKKRQKVDEGRAILMKSGALRRSISMRHGEDYWEIYTVSQYAKIHNEGGKIAITEQMRRFFWAMHYKEKKRGRTDAANYYKALALTQKAALDIPKRQFMGASKLLERRVVAQVERGLSNALR